MSTPKVQYGYANGSANTVRPTSLTYPDGRVLMYDYGTTDGIDDASSRIFALVDDDMGSTHLAEYSYLGRNSFVKVDYTEPELEYVLFDLAGSNDPDTGDIYSGFDLFGRVKDSRWYDYGSSADADRIKYGYDRNSNRIWRQNTVADALGKHFDELYGYDRINRLKDLDRGTLNGGKDGVTDLSFAECWALDQTGNWKNYRQDDNGSGTWDLNQHRAANTVNEITDISESAGPSWVTPVYNRAGNMTTMPQPNDPTASYVATYDAWNRLVKLVDGADTVSEYAYDGARRRVIQKTYVSGVLDETRHMYYTEPSMWQVMEERVGSETTADKQFVWGLRYVDEIVLRDDTTQRLYGMQDANWNVTSIANDVGDVQERFAYSAYGVPTFLNASFVVQSSYVAGWNIWYCGYQYETVTALYHIRNRTYHDRLGKWIQRDSIDFSEEYFLYSYVESDPLSATDPTGLESKSDFCLRVFPSPTPKDTASKKTWECVLTNCLSDIANPKKFAKCLAICGVKSASKDIKLWIIHLICCNTAGDEDSRDPCACGLQRNVVVECGMEVIKLEPGPCQDPSQNATHTLTGRHCTDCCEYQACIDGLTTIGSLTGVLNSTFNKTTCDFNCIGK